MALNNSLSDLANHVRHLAISMVENASSGHPGAPLGMADFATVLWKKFLRYHPGCPHSEDRDRVVLSNGHACAMLYAICYLAESSLTLDDLKAFRQLNSKTPGHPERDTDIGVDVATGPLGQGVANAVGMAIARDACEHPQDYTVYAFVGDGCLMEGISYEACSLAATLKLRKLVLLYDSNQISIDGNVKGWMNEDISARFSKGWHVIDQVDGHDFDAIEKAFIEAKAHDDKPVIIVFNTTIGRFVPDWAGTAEVHGQPLGALRAEQTRKNMGLSLLPFEVDESILASWRDHDQGRLSSSKPLSMGPINIDWPSMYQWASEQDLPQATRKANQSMLAQLPIAKLIGGSADLTGSVLSHVSGQKLISSTCSNGDYIQYGVREFAMCAIANGMATLGDRIPYVGTFLTFADYAKNAIRMAALMKLRVIYLFTHDSIGLGEDGPTHQPIEQLAMLRATPGLAVWRPCDIDEVVSAWHMALTMQSQPTCMILSRQTLPKLSKQSPEALQQGAYAIQPNDDPDMIIVATGSEVSLALDVAKQLTQDNAFKIRVVSMPCMEVFRQQDPRYKEGLLPRHVFKVALEAASPQPWYEWVGQDGLVVGMTSFGCSGSQKDVMRHFGFTVEDITAKILKQFKKEMI